MSCNFRHRRKRFCHFQWRNRDSRLGNLPCGIQRKRSGRRGIGHHHGLDAERNHHSGNDHHRKHIIQHGNDVRIHGARGIPRQREFPAGAAQQQRHRHFPVCHQQKRIQPYVVPCSITERRIPPVLHGTGGRFCGKPIDARCRAWNRL